MEASSSSRVPSPRARCPCLCPGLVALTAPLSFLAAFPALPAGSLGSHRLVPVVSLGRLSSARLADF